MGLLTNARADALPSIDSRGYAQYAPLPSYVALTQSTASIGRSAAIASSSLPQAHAERLYQ